MLHVSPWETQVGRDFKTYLVLDLVLHDTQLILSVCCRFEYFIVSKYCHPWQTGTQHTNLSPVWIFMWCNSSGVPQPFSVWLTYPRWLKLLDIVFSGDWQPWRCQNSAQFNSHFQKGYILQSRTRFGGESQSDSQARGYSLEARLSQRRV